MLKYILQQKCFYLCEAGESRTPTLTRGSALMHKGSVLESKENINLCYSATAILDTHTSTHQSLTPSPKHCLKYHWFKMTDSFPVLISLVLNF